MRSMANLQMNLKKPTKLNKERCGNFLSSEKDNNDKKHNNKDKQVKQYLRIENYNVEIFIYIIMCLMETPYGKH